MEYILNIVGPMLEGTVVTLKMFFVTIVLSLPLGLGLALGRISRYGWLHRFIGMYIWLFRGTPLMLQLLFVYFALPLIPYVGVKLSDFSAAMLALSDVVLSA